MRKRRHFLRSIAIALAVLLAFSGNSSMAVQAAQSAVVRDVNALADDPAIGELKLVYGDEALADEDAFVLLIMGDGFTAEEQDKFYTEAKNTADYIMTCSPYDEFMDAVKIYALGVTSNESGVQGENAASEAEAAEDVRDTYFGASFWTWGMQRLVDLTEEGAAKGNAIRDSVLPTADYIAYLVNSTTYGGSGGEYCIASLNSQSLEMMLQEMGHTVAGLSDEYYAAGYEYENSNLTQESDPAKVSWSRFIGKNGIGVYDWGGVSGIGWYVPHTGCKMQYLGAEYPFCEVCKEELRKAISADSNVTEIFFQTYADEFAAGAGKDMKEYFILRKGTNEITGDKLGDALTLTYKNADGNVVDGIPNEAGTYTIEASFAGNDIYDACSMTVSYTIDAVSISLDISSKNQDGKPAELKYSVDYGEEYSIGISYYGYQYYGYYTYDEYTSYMVSDTLDTSDDVYNVVYYKYDSYNSEYLAYEEYQTKEGPSGPGNYTVTFTVYDKEGNELGEKSVNYNIYLNTEAITDNNDYTYYGASDYGNNKNILIYGEGFTEEEQDKFLELAGDLVNGILSTEPFKETALYFNFMAVECISDESGIGTAAKDTFFHLTYDENGAIVPSYTATDIATNLASSIKQYYDGCIVIVNDDKASDSSTYHYDYSSYAYFHTIYVTPDAKGIEYAADELINHLLLNEVGYRAETDAEKGAQRLALIDTLFYEYAPVIVSRAYDERFTEDGTAFDLTSSFKVYYDSEELSNVPLALTYYTDNAGKPGEKLDGAPSKAGTYHVLAETVPNDVDGWLWYVPEGGTDDDGIWIGLSRGWTTYTIAEAEKEPETTTSGINYVVMDVIDGDGTYIKGTEGTLTVRANGEFAKFQGLKLDGEAVDSSNYTAKAGSTIVTLSNAFLETLAEGNHTLTFVYFDGEASMTFSVEAAQTETSATEAETESQTEAETVTEEPEATAPSTGAGSMAAWLVLLMVSASGIVVLCYNRKVGKHAEM